MFYCLNLIEFWFCIYDNNIKAFLFKKDQKGKVYIDSAFR